MKQISIKSDRVEDRLQALESIQRSRGYSGSRAPEPNTTRPDLPTVKLDPNEPTTESTPEAERTSEAGLEEAHRPMIVGEGSRVETRVAGDASPSHAASAAAKTNARAPKRFQGNVPTASDGGAAQ